MKRFFPVAEQGVSTSCMKNTSHSTKLCSVLPWPPEPCFSGFDYILWVLIVADLAWWWLRLIRRSLLQTQNGCLLTSTFTGRWGTRLKFILPLGGMTLILPPPVQGPESPFTPRPPASPPGCLTYWAQLFLQLLNNAPPLFTNTVEGRTLLSSLQHNFLTYNARGLMWHKMIWM